MSKSGAVVEQEKVAFIVVSYNRGEDLKLSLEAIFATGYPQLEVIVVDNDSRDHARDVARSFPRVRLLCNDDNKGFAEANNQGLAVTDADFIALVNNDAVIPPNWIDDHLAFLRGHPTAVAVGGKAYLWNDENPLGDRSNSFIGPSTLMPDADTPAELDASDEPRQVVTLSGAAVLLRRRAIDDVGPPFLEPLFFTYYEETDFFARALRRGWTLHYTGEPACWHRVRASTQKAPYHYYFHMRRNRILFAHRHLDDATLARILAISRREWLEGTFSRYWKKGEQLDVVRARRDAYLWARKNQRLLQEHRLLHHTPGESYQSIAARIQSAASARW